MAAQPSAPKVDVPNALSQGGLCEACSGLDFSTVPKAGATSQFVPFGTVSELFQREARCPLCEMLASTVRRICPKAGGDDTDGRPATLEILMQNASFQSEEGWPLNEAMWLWYSCVEPLGASGHRKSKTNLAILRQTSHPLLSVQTQLETCQVGDNRDWFSRARFIGRRQADARLFREWLRLCDSTHPLCTHQSKGAGVNLKQFWLVHVPESRVLFVPPGCTYRYLALSYVWGPIQPLRLTKHNMDKLQVPGVLKLPEVRAGIPQTIQDAMAVAEAVGVDYLWVDTLCIPQDDTEVKQQIMQQMHLVYSNAVLTIVAAAGTNANAGLPGMQYGSRDNQQTAWRINERHFLGADLEPDNGLGSGFQSSTWRTRAWTYEEALFSSRMLVFTEEQVYWYCPQTEPGGWREDTVAEITDAQYIKDDLCVGVMSALVYGRGRNDGGERFDVVSNNDFFKFRRMANQYSCRELTKPYDALNAFLGIESALKEGYSEFVWGIPERDFAYGLCWNFAGSVASSSGHKIRDHASGSSRTVAFPSWSWTNWRLPVTETHVAHWKRGSGVWGLQFRRGAGVFQRCAKFFRLDHHGKQIEIQEDPKHTMECEDRDLSSDNTMVQNDTAGESSMLSSVNILKCYTRVASLVINCLEHRHARDMELYGSRMDSSMTFDRDDIPSTFALQDMCGNWVATSYVCIEDDRSFLPHEGQVNTVTRTITAVAIAGFSGVRAGKEHNGGVHCLLTEQDRLGYFHRIGIAQILHHKSRDDLLMALNSDLTFDFDIPEEHNLKGWTDIRSGEQTVYLL